MEQEIAEHKKHAQDLELSLKKAESEKQVCMVTLVVELVRKGRVKKKWRF